MISDGVQASMAPSAMVCKVLMDCSRLSTHERSDSKLNSELKVPFGNPAPTSRFYVEECCLTPSVTFLQNLGAVQRQQENTSETSPLLPPRRPSRI